MHINASPVITSYYSRNQVQKAENDSQPTYKSLNNDQLNFTGMKSALKKVTKKLLPEECKSIKNVNNTFIYNLQGKDAIFENVDVFGIVNGGNVIIKGDSIIQRSVENVKKVTLESTTVKQNIKNVENLEVKKQSVVEGNIKDTSRVAVYNGSTIKGDVYAGDYFYAHNASFSKLILTGKNAFAKIKSNCDVKNIIFEQCSGFLEIHNYENTLEKIIFKNGGSVKHISTREIRGVDENAFKSRVEGGKVCFADASPENYYSGQGFQ